MTARVIALCLGTAAPFARGATSAIDKRPAIGPVRVTKLGLAGDEQADRRVHGGEEMALHAYCNDHYGWWIEQLGEHHRLPAAGSFGENLALTGIAEAEVRIGDRFRLGSALVEVSQPRQPCWKLETHLRRDSVITRILSSHRCGWYCRVIEEGEAEAPTSLEIVDSNDETMSVAQVFAAMLDPGTLTTVADYRAIAALPRLSPEWRKRAKAKAERAG